MLRGLESAARRLDLGGRGVLVAVSGGVDSTALLQGFADLAPALRLRLAAGHVNHGLRGAESDGDEDAVRAHAARLGIPVTVERVEPHALREQAARCRERPTLQEAARRLRYDALARHARALDLDCVATAHHADDQAETLLLRLLRGAAAEGLAGIPERSPDGRVVRPLLRFARAEIAAFAEQRGLVWREDPSNASPDYARSRLRTRWIPGLAAEFNPALLRALARTAEAQRRDVEWMESLVEEAARERFGREGDDLTIALPGWSELPEALALRLARRALREVGLARDVSNIHLVRVVEFLRAGAPGRAIELPGGRVLAREADRFRLGAPTAARGGGVADAC